MFNRTALVWAALFISTSIHPAAAAASDAKLLKEGGELRVSKLGDTELSCAALEEEALRMRGIIHSNQRIEDDSELKSRGIGVGGAVGSLILGTMTAGIGLAAAGFLATEAVEDEGEEADGIKEIAAQRRSLMVGIYHAKGCEATDGSIEHVMQQPVTAPKKPAKVQMVSSTEEPRTAAPVVSVVAPAAGTPAPKPFTYND
jgi:hypothetical protein